MFGGIGAVSNLPELSRFVTYYTLPIDGNVGLVGLRGFFLGDAIESTAVDLFVSYLPLVITGAMLFASLMGQRTGLIAQAIATFIISGVMLPVIGFWVWGGGWLAALGANLSLGHGAVDIGALSTVALVAGGAGLVWLVTSPRQQPSDTPELPQSIFPLRAFCGAGCALIGLVAFVAGNPLYANFAEETTSALLVNMLMATGIAVIVSIAYSVFATRRPEVLAAARAVIAALIAVAAGGMLLPVWTVVLLGVATGLLATLGLYITREVLRWPDDGAVMSTVLLPAVMGLLCVGLFANGSGGQGWNGAGAVDYLGVVGLGIVGALTPAGIPSDPGQLTAQLATAGVVLAFSVLLFAPAALLLHRFSTPQQIDEVVEEPTHEELRAPATEPALGRERDERERDEHKRHERERDERERTVQAPFHDLLTAGMQSASIESVSAEATATPSPLRSFFTRYGNGHPISQNNTSEPSNGADPAPEQDPSQPPPAKPERRESLIDRLRRARTPRPPETPTQARRIAYPTRIGSRRIAIRPIPKPDEGQRPADGA